MKIRGAPPTTTLIFMIASAAATAGPGAAQEAKVVELERAPDALKARRRETLELAYLRLSQKRWNEAVALLGALLDETPGDARLRMELGYARHALGDRAAAADEFRLAAKGPNEFSAQALAALAVLGSPGAESESLANEGYEELRRADKAAARDKFSRALLADPGRTMIAKQLGYMSLADGDMAAAASHLAGVRRLAPLDHETALELGYIYDSLHDEAGAEKSFAAALSSADPGLRAEARKALDSIRGRTDPLYVDVDGAAYATSRFANEIIAVDARAGWKPKPAGPVAVYLAARGTQDTRSRSGETPEIYADDAVSFAPGVRFQPQGWSASLSAESGLTVNLLRSREHPNQIQADSRVVWADYHYWQGPRRFFVDAAATVGYYSRYRGNVIGSLQLRAGVKAWDNRTTQLSLYAPLKALKDANRDFYNNVVEVGAGLELQPTIRRNLKVRAEYLRGAYTGVSGRDPNPYGARYEDFRLMLVYSAHFTRRRRPDSFEPTRRRRFAW